MSWLSLLVDPVTLIGAALLGLCWGLRHTAWRGPLGFAASLTAFYLWAATPLGANLVVGALEGRAEDRTDCNPAVPGSVIIVLAGGMSGSPSSAAQFSRLHESTLRRTMEGVRLATQIPDSRLIMAGGSGSEVREADLMASLARALGFPPERLRLERSSQTTHESAAAVGEMLRTEESAGSIVLATSALHMPRALGAFRYAGIAACPYPVDYRRVEPRLHEMLIPQSSALGKSVQAYHEIAGLLVYRITGRM